MNSVIAGVGHVALRVRDASSAVRTAHDLLGLEVTEERDGRVYLSHGAPHHSLVYIPDDHDALDHIGLVARDVKAVPEIRKRVIGFGLEVSADGPLTAGTRDGFAFIGPEGFVFEISSAQEQIGSSGRYHSPRAVRFGHVNLSVREPLRMQELFQSVLDFRVSDTAGDGAFLRCNVDHHGVGVFPGTGVLHHYAWEARAISDLADLADAIDERGASVLWGPARHGIGRNIATYYAEACGAVVEVYTEMKRIYDETTYEPKHWTLDGHKWFSLWGPQLPEGFMERGVAPASREGSVVSPRT